jgi:hypothetical protein
MADDVRAQAQIYMSQVPMIGEIRSNGDTLAKTPFKTLTARTQAELLEQWKTNRTTTCNEFVGQYTIKLLGLFLGQFRLETCLKKLGKSHAYVKSEPGARPKYGDIFKHKSFHMGVFLDLDGDVISTAESGQGGPKVGYDIIKRKRVAFNTADYEGWCDIAAYATPKPRPNIAEFLGPVPEWLGGWWQVWWHGQAYYFHFDENRVARWTRVKPHNQMQPPGAVNDTGQLLIDINNGVFVQWSAKSAWTDVFARDIKRNDTLAMIAKRV